tara:strand:- start:491 stop:679 length:189 start_codon:yes stop_codon:yes gene_type:complete
MMKKEFEIKDILTAINNISKIDRKKTKNTEKKASVVKDDVLALHNQVKSDKSKILVLDEMIE